MSVIGSNLIGMGDRDPGVPVRPIEEGEEMTGDQEETIEERGPGIIRRTRPVRPVLPRVSRNHQVVVRQKVNRKRKVRRRRGVKRRTRVKRKRRVKRH